MGVNVSRNLDLSENEYLKRFVGKEHIPVTDHKFWDTFLQYHIIPPTNSQEQLSLDSRLESLCQSFISHNLLTGNFGSLLLTFLNKVAALLELSDQEISLQVWQTFNGLFIIRCLIKYIIETGSEYQLLQHFEALPNDRSTTHQAANDEPTTSTGSLQGNENEVSSTISIVPIDGCKFESFFDAVVNMIVVIPVKEFTYHLHLEAVNTILVLFSLHLFTNQPTATIFKTIYKNQHSNKLMGTLLHSVSRMVEVPQSMFGITGGSSFVFGIAESLLSLFTFRKSHHQDYLNANDLISTFKQHYPLANQCLLLILVLTNHSSTKNNPYRASLFNCSDSQGSPKDKSSFKIDFNILYNTLSRIVTVDQATLLLYLLLHRNPRFYRYVMALENVQQMVIPILQTLYNAPDSTSHHIYMSLIVLLILSEDDGFNKNVHQIVAIEVLSTLFLTQPLTHCCLVLAEMLKRQIIKTLNYQNAELGVNMLKNIFWYTERSISDISLGGLLVLVVIRTIQYNMLKMRDKYLHTNCLAALANMSSQFRSLHPYVAQRLVSLFEILAKKHARLDTQIKHPNNDTNAIVVVNLNETASSTSNKIDDMDLSVLEEVLRMVLEIINSCLSHQLVYCPNLVYTLLYKKQIFEMFRSHSAFEDIIQNIDMVVGFFSSRLQRVQDQRGELGVSEVLEVISKGASQWSNDRLRKFPDLKFKYVEEDKPEEFFIPYVWTLVTQYGCIHFSSESMKSVTKDIMC